MYRRPSNNQKSIYYNIITRLVLISSLSGLITLSLTTLIWNINRSQIIEEIFARNVNNVLTKSNSFICTSKGDNSCIYHLSVCGCVWVCVCVCVCDILTYTNILLKTINIIEDVSIELIDATGALVITIL